MTPPRWVDPEALDRYVWWAEGLGGLGLVRHTDCRLPSAEDAEQLYAEMGPCK